MTPQFTRLPYGLLALLFSLFSFHVSGQGDCLGNWTITTQAEVDGFACTLYEGNITIIGEEITNLNGLSELREIDGHLNISSTGLTNLNGLENLEFISTNLYIGGNVNLIAASLPKLEVTDRGYFWLEDNPALTDLNFPELERVGFPVSADSSFNVQSLRLNGNDALTILDGFSALASIGNNFYINDNQNLASIITFENLNTIGGNLQIQDNPNLSDCCAIQPLLSLFDNVDGNIIIEDNLLGCSSEEEVLLACEGEVVEHCNLDDCPTTPISLNTWTQTGEISNGNWAVSADGQSVFQSINGDPTFFVSPEDFINTSIRGSFRVATSTDDDLIGFVFGYQSPNSNTGDYNFILFDWKQTSQSASGYGFAPEGFSLSRINGNFANITELRNVFWQKISHPALTVLDTDFADNGWADNTMYNFRLDYFSNSIKIYIDDNLIFDVNGNFPSGKFGFYNYSQPNVEYMGFSEAVSCVTFYADADGDGFGDANNTIEDCTAPENFVANSDDCDDNNPNLNIQEGCVIDTLIVNGTDENCNQGNGLLAYYTFDGNANDESGNNHNATGINTVSATTDRNGVPNSAYQFNGTGTIAVDENIDDFRFNNQSLTISTWVTLADNNNDYEGYVSIGNAGLGIDLYKRRSGLPDGNIAYLHRVGSNLNIANSILPGDELPLNEWLHLVGVTDAENQEIKLYINGELQEIIDLTLDYDFTNQSNFQVLIGQRAGISTFAQDGNIDDVRIYNRALSETEILELYDCEQPEEITFEDDCNAEEQLVSYFPMDNSPNDVISGNQGTVFGAIPTTDRFGNPNAAYEFDGNDDYIDLGDSTEYRMNTDYAISMWVYIPTDEPQFGNLIQKRRPNGDFNMYSLVMGGEPNSFTVEGNYPYFVQRPDVNPVNNRKEIFDPNGFLPVGWHHLVVSNEVGGMASLYIDNVLVGSSAAQNGTANIVGESLYIGGNPSVNDSFEGKIDDVRLYHRSLSADEIAGIYACESGGIIDPACGNEDCLPSESCQTFYADTDTDGFGDLNNTTEACTTPEGFVANSDDCDDNNPNLNIQDGCMIDSLIFNGTDENCNIGTGLVAYYPFNNNINDASGNGNNGEIINNVNLAIDRFGNASSAYNSEGNGYINVPNSAALTATQTGFTVASWVKVRRWFGNWAIVLDLSNGSDASRQYSIAINRNGLIQTRGGCRITTTPLELHKWYHIAVSYDRNTGQQIYYIDGANVGTTTCGAFALNVAQSLTIGLDRPGASEIHNGKLDEIRIYNRPISTNEVQEIYSCESEGEFVLDSDSDEILDEVDNCPLMANTDQIDGDMDNFGEVCDCDDNDVALNIQEGCMIDTTSCTTTGDLIFTTQVELDAFDQNCAILDGNLIINGDDITDLSNLINLQKINGSVIIGDTIQGNIGNDLLENLNGLSGITDIGGDLIICQNPMLVSLSGFSMLMSVDGDILVKNCIRLENLNLIRLSNIGGDFILRGLSFLIELGPWEWFFLGGSFIVESTGLEYFTLPGSNNVIINGDFYFINNPALTEIDVTNLIQLLGCFHVINNTLIEEIPDLSNLEVIGEDIRIIDNDLIDNVDNLANLTTVNGSLIISENDLLENLDGLSSLLHVGDTLVITNNPALNDCCGIYDLLNDNGVGGFIDISGNPSECSSDNEILETCPPPVDNDMDNDGFTAAEDCDDNNPDINPDTTEIPGNTIDENCDGIAEDMDNDGFNIDEDCDDNNPNINPDAIEIANNQIDDNCNGLIDELLSPCDFENPLTDLPWLANIVANPQLCMTSIRQTELDGEIVFVIDYPELCGDPDEAQFATELIFIIYDCAGNVICIEGFVEEPCGFNPPTGTPLWTSDEGCLVCDENNYTPVCVGDTMTFNNACFAICAGFTDFTLGECDDPASCDNLTDGGEICCNQTLCGGNTNPEPLTSISLPSGGDENATIEYLWIYTTMNPADSPFQEWQVYGNSNTAEFDLDNITQTTWIRRCARRAGCHDYLSESNIIQITVLEDCAVNCEDLSVAMTLQDATCFGATDGGVNLTVEGGTLPYSFEWSNSATSEDLANVTAGMYSVSITDANDCSISAMAAIQEPTALEVSLTSSDADCTNGGSINLTVSGGMPPYSFEWSNGEVSEDLSNLSTGEYTGTVSDSKGCNFTTTVTISSSEAPVITSNVSPETCDLNDGAIDITVSGGSGNYSYLWNNNTTTEDLTDLSSGEYKVVVTDNISGCVTIAEVVVVLNCESSCENYSLEITNVTGLDCDGNLGAIDLTFIDNSNDNAEISFVWNDGATTEDRSDLVAGIYSVTVTVNDCNFNAEITLSDCEEIECSDFSLEITSATSPDCEGNLGAIDMTFTNNSGDSPNVDFIWNDGATTEDRDNLETGTYSVTVTFENCVYTADIELNEPNCCSDFSLEVINLTPLDCEGNLAAIEMAFTNEMNEMVDANFVWSDGATTKDRENLEAGVYTVWVVHGDCTYSAEITIEACEEVSCDNFTLEITHITPVDCDGNLGTIDVTFADNMGNMPDLDFVWNDGATTEDRTDLLAGVYSVTVAFENCTYEAEVTLTAPTCPEDENTASTCSDGVDNDLDGLVDCEDPDCDQECVIEDCNFDGLVAYYPFNGDANDKSGNDNHGDLLGNATIDDVLTTGNNNVDRLELPNTVLNGLQDLTISLNVNFSIFQMPTGNQTFGNVIVSGANNQNDNAFVLAYNKNTTDFRVAVNGTQYFLGNINLEESTWYSVALRRIGGVFEVFVDGNSVSEMVNNNSSISVIEGGLFIGQEQDAVGGQFDANQSLSGQLDNFRIFNRGLSNTEIETLISCDEVQLVEGNDFQFLSITPELLPDNSVRLRWTTTGEADNGHHIIRHGADTLQFRTKGDILDGKGSSNEVQVYEWLDEAPRKGMNYYHIHHLDSNGNSYLSTIVSAYIHTIDGAFLVPNPTMHTTTLDFVQALEKDTPVVLYNNMGQPIRSLLVPAGTIRYELDLTDYLPGMYHVYYKKYNKRAKVLRLVKGRL